MKPCNIMAKAGIQLGKWSSNAKVVCGSLGSLVDNAPTKILGIEWFPEKDVFTFLGVCLLMMLW